MKWHDLPLTCLVPILRKLEANHIKKRRNTKSDDYNNHRDSIYLRQCSMLLTDRKL